MEQEKTSSPIDEIIDRHCKLNMQQWDLSHFKNDFSSLYKAIYGMVSEQQIDKLKLQSMLNDEIKLRKEKEQQLDNTINQHWSTYQRVVKDFNEINNQLPEGKLLMAAMAMIASESRTDCTPFQVLEYLGYLAAAMHYSGDDPNVKKILDEALEAHRLPEVDRCADLRKEKDEHIQQLQKVIEDKTAEIMQLKNKKVEVEDHGNTIIYKGGHFTRVLDPGFDAQLKEQAAPANTERSFPPSEQDNIGLTSDAGGISLEDAMQVITRELIIDEDYRMGWLANIAMAFMDAYQNKQQFRNEAHRLTIHEIANEAALNFIRLLCDDHTLTSPYLENIKKKRNEEAVEHHDELWEKVQKLQEELAVANGRFEQAITFCMIDGAYGNRVSREELKERIISDFDKKETYPWVKNPDCSGGLYFRKGE